MAKSAYARSARRLFSALAVTIVATTSARAFAAETPAERLFREGRALMLEDRFDEACPMLAESQRLDPHVGTLLNLAACHERQGKVGSAWVEYQKTLTAARAEGQAERARLAEDRIEVLEPRVPWLRISSVEGATITLDGTTLAPASLGPEMPVDPGLHVVRAERPRAAAPFEERVELREGEHRTVIVRFSDVDAHAPASPERLVIEPKPEASATPKRKGRWILEPGVFVGYLVGNVERGGHVEPLYPASVALTSPNDALTSCAEVQCYLQGIKEGDGFTGGVNVFAGYALTDTIDVGGRFIAGPEVGPAGASVVAFGPSIAVHPTDALTVGAWALVGNATLKGRAQVVPPPHHVLSSSSFVSAAGDLIGGPGVGLELSLRLFELGRGVVVANTTPFVVAGSGTAFCFPVGLAYRFQ